MEQFFLNPGLCHIGKSILMFLDHKSLISCRSVCKSWKNIIDNPRFWGKKCAQVDLIFSKTQNNWIEMIKKIEENEDPVQEIEGIFHLMKLHQILEKSQKIAQGAEEVAILIKKFKTFKTIFEIKMYLKIEKIETVIKR